VRLRLTSPSQRLGRAILHEFRIGRVVNVEQPGGSNIGDKLSIIDQSCYGKFPRNRAERSADRNKLRIILCPVQIPS
jgi:hypothetical protein